MIVKTVRDGSTKSLYVPIPSEFLYSVADKP